MARQIAQGRWDNDGLTWLEYGTVLKEPTGFQNKTDSTLSFDNGTRTLTITPGSDGCVFWVQGVMITLYTPVSKQITDVEGLHFFYFTVTAGEVALNETTDTSSLDFTSQAFVAYVLWDADNSIAMGGVYEERHGYLMPGKVHEYLHETFGAKFESGLAPGNILADESGALDTHAQLSIADGEIHDEDNEIYINDGDPQDISPILKAPVYYLSGAGVNLRRIAPTNFPVTTTGTGRLAWNEYTGGAWQLTEVTNTKFVLCHIFATNNLSEPIIALVGQNEYATKSLARDGADAEINSLIYGTLPILEIVPICTLIFQTADSYANSVKARVVTTDTGDSHVDWRFSGVTAGGGTNDHNNLTSLQGGAAAQYYHLDQNTYDQITAADAASLLLGTSGDTYVEILAATDIINMVAASAVNIGNGTSTLAITWSSDDVYITNTDDDGLIYLRASTGGVPVTCISMDAAGAVVLNYAGNESMKSASGGITVASGGILYIHGASNIEYETMYNSRTQLFSGLNSVAAKNSMLLMDPDAGVKAYYQGLLNLETISGGIEIGDGAAAGITITYSTDDAYIINTDPDGEVFIQARNAADSATNTLFHADPDGASAMYHAGIISIETDAAGLSMYTAAGLKGQVTFSGNVLQLINTVSGGGIQLAGKDGGASDHVVLYATPGSTLTLYYDEMGVLETQNNGVDIGNAGSPSGFAELRHTGTDWSVLNKTNSGLFYLQGSNSGGDAKNLFSGDPDGASALFHTGVLRLSTTTAGVEIGDGVAAGLTIEYSSDDIIITNTDPDGLVIIKARNQADTATNTMISSDPDGGVSLSYAGVSVLQTYSDTTNAAGIVVYDAVETNSLYLGINNTPGTAFFRNQYASGHLKLQGINSSVAITDMVSCDPDAGVDLYHNGGLRLSTTSAGVEIGDGAAAGFTIEYSSDDAILTNTDPDGLVIIKARNNGDSATNTMISADPDAGVDLYYANSPVFYIKAANAAFIGNGASGFLYLGIYGAGGLVQFNTHLYLDNQATSSHLLLRAENAATTMVKLFEGDPDAGVDLYYMNSLRLSTMSTGITVTDGTAAGFDIEFSSDDVVLTNLDPDGVVIIRARNAANTAYNYLFDGDPDGAASLYNAGVKTLYTYSTGIVVGDGTNALRIVHDGWAKLISLTNGAPILMTGLNNSAVEKYLINADPDGAVSLYYAGQNTLNTISSGISITNATQLSTFTQDSVDFIMDFTASGGTVTLKGEASGDKTMLTLNPAGSVSQYYNGSIRTATVSGGLQVVTSGATIELAPGAASGSIIYSYKHSDPVVIQAENASGVAKNVFLGNPDGLTRLYYAGSEVIYTQSTGLKTTGARTAQLLDGIISIKGDTGGWAVAFGFYGSSDTYHGGWGCYGSADAINYYWVGQAYNDTCLIAYPNAQLQLYYDNQLNARTLGTGAGGGLSLLNNSTTSPGMLYFGGTGTDGSWRIAVSGDNLVIQQRESGTWNNKSVISGA